jgi:hypothetical protein
MRRRICEVQDGLIVDFEDGGDVLVRHLWRAMAVSKSPGGTPAVRRRGWYRGSFKQPL